MSQHYRLLFSFVVCFFVTVFFFSPAHSQSPPPAGTVVSWGSQVLSTEENKDFIDIAAGLAHSLALRSDGSVAAWGRDDYGQSTVPPGLVDVVAVAAGRWHSLALSSDGAVAAWGRDDYGQSTVPPGLEEVVAVAAGEWYSIALRDDGTVVAWGYDGARQSTVPPGLEDVVAVTAGSDYNLAIVNNEFSTSSEPIDSDVPSTFSLEQNYPNPFNPTTNIRFELPESSMITLEIYNILGQKVAQLVNERKRPGRYEVNFDASGLSSGVYLYRLQTESYMETRQMMLIK